jgi:hypothetical protein
VLHGTGNGVLRNYRPSTRAFLPIDPGFLTDALSPGRLHGPPGVKARSGKRNRIETTMDCQHSHDHADRSGIENEPRVSPEQDALNKSLIQSIEAADVEEDYVEPVYEAKTRTCLSCAETFESAWSGERICRSCKSKASWRSGWL